MRFSSSVDRMRDVASGGWELLAAAWEDQRRGEDVIILSIGDPDFETPRPIVDAAVDALYAGDTHYADFQGRPELRRLIAERFSATTGREWTEDNVMVTVGTQNALFASAFCLLEAGDEVITYDPAYLTYEATFTATGAEMVRISQNPDDGFRFDADAVAERVGPRTRGLVITTPNNPTGAMATQAELEALAELAIANDLWVLADEVYADLVFDGEHHSMAAVEGMADRTITVSSLSKSHAMTGWRLGWAIAPVELVDKMNKLAVAVTYGLPGFIQAAGIEALRRPETVTAMRDTYLRRRDVVLEELATEPRLSVLKPRAGMYVMVDVRGLAETSRDFAWGLYRATGVSVVDARAFGEAAEGWLRIAFTQDEETLREGCRRLIKYVNSLDTPS